MKCLNPTTAWICGTKVAKDGLLGPNVVFSSTEAMQYFARLGSIGLKAMSDSQIEFPCGKCQACKLRARRDMTTRLTHEASCHDCMCFVTLTYEDKYLPVADDGKPTLVVRDVQLFLKRLRRHLEYHYGYKGLRYFAVGEYGSRFHRPHYHLLLFGWRPDDLVLFKRKGNIDTYLSATIAKLWHYGFVTVEDVTSCSCKYCARYVSKKFVNDYTLTDAQLPEFILRSCRNGGIGAAWCDKYGADSCRRGYVTYRLKDFIVKQSIPKYYFTRLRSRNPNVYQEIRNERIAWLKTHKPRPVDYDEILRGVEKQLYDIKQEKEREVF